MVQQDAHERMHKSGGLHVSRRTVARGMAWSVPAVAVATAAPAFAVSRVPPDFAFVGACKFPGNSCSKANKGYGFAFEVTNNDSRALSFCTASLSINPPDPFPGVTFTYTGGCIDVGGGETGTAFFYFSGSGDSANSPFTGTLTVSYANNCGECGTSSAQLPPLAVSVGATPPHGLCDCDATWIPS